MTRADPAVALDQDSTPIAVIEMSQSSGRGAATVPGLKRRPLKKPAPDPRGSVRVAGALAGGGRQVRPEDHAHRRRLRGRARRLPRLARRLRARGIAAHAIHPTRIPVKRDHRRAKTGRLDTERLERAFLGWRRGEPEHGTMAAIPTLAPDAGPRRWPPTLAPDTGRGGPQAPEPRARDPGRRAHAQR